MQPGHITSLLTNLVALHQQWSALNDQFARQIETLRTTVTGPDLPDDENAAVQQPLYATYFNRFTLYRGQTPLTLGSNKACIELCRYLIAHAGCMVARDELLELLWPDTVPARTSHRLHVTISQLRRIIDPVDGSTSYIIHEDNHYAIIACTILTDCQLFDSHYCAGKEYLERRDYRAAASAFQAALALYKGDFLSDHRYADWTHLHRAYYAELRTKALIFLCEHAADEGQFAAVIDYAQQILRVDNLQELAHRWLMRVYYLTGQRALAIRQYRICRDLLAQELGVSPSQQTEALHAAIRHDKPLPDEPTLFG